jgi:hypothetical protein
MAEGLESGSNRISKGIAPVAPKAAALLPIAYVAHLAEEWLGGFIEWTPEALGYEMSVERFVLINAAALVTVVAGTFAAFRNPRLAWLTASFAALFGLNGMLHGLATVGLGSGYSPGAISGLVLYVPLAAIVLRSCAERLPKRTFTGAVVFGLVLHALVPVLAFL